MLRTIFLSLPFSGTHYVLRHNVYRATNLTGQLHLVCKICWIHLRHVSTLCEPCAGCEFFDHIGFELDIFLNQERGGCMVAPPLLGRLFTPKIYFLFNRYPLDTRESYDFSRLAHPWQTHRRQPPRMDQLVTYFQTLISFIFHFFHSHSLDSSTF